MLALWSLGLSRGLLERFRRTMRRVRARLSGRTRFGSRARQSRGHAPAALREGAADRLRFRHRHERRLSRTSSIAPRAAKRNEGKCELFFMRRRCGQGKVLSRMRDANEARATDMQRLRLST